MNNRLNFLLLFFFLASLVLSCNSKDVKKNNSQINNEKIEYSRYNYDELDEKHKGGELDSNFFCLDKQYIVDIPFMYAALAKGVSTDTMYCIDITNSLDASIKDGGDIPIYEIINGKVNRKNLYYPKGIANKYQMIQSATVFGDKLFVVLVCDVLIYDRNNLKLTHIIRCPEISFSNISFINDKIYLQNNIFGCCASNELPKIYEFDSKTYKLIKTHNFDKLKGINMTHFQPKENIGVWKNGFFVSDVTRYNIKFYDFDMNLTSSISFKPDTWISNDTLIEQIDKYNSCNQFRIDIEKKKLTETSTLESVKFINDSTIMVIRENHKLHSGFYCDFWRLSNNKWRLLYADLKSRISEKRNINKKYSQLLNATNGCYFENGQFVIPDPTPFDITKYPFYSEGTYADYFKARMEYAENNEQMRSSVVVFKLIAKEFR